MVSCCEGLSRPGEIELLRADQGVDLFVARNRSKYDYIDAVDEVSQRTLNSCSGVIVVRQNSIILSRALLRMDFRYTSKSKDF